MPIHAIIFDMAGVILRIEDQPARRQWETRLGLTEEELFRQVFENEASPRAMIGQATDAQVWNWVADALHLSNAQAKELARDFWAGNHVDQVLMQFIRGLRPRYKTALLSNAWLSTRAEMIDRFGLADEFDTVIISSEEGIAKPDARIYRLAAKRLGVQPEQAIFVDDVAENVDAARAVGMRGIHFQDTAQTIAELARQLELDSG
jgi:epoxide hydrolase-like predicted phosphatase